jgi:predicted DNA-binding transcriptional regulator YafY
MTTSWTRSTNGERRRSHSANLFGRAPLSRLLRLVLVLQSGRAPNAKALGEVCEVSPRTIYRDLELLAGAGVPVSYSHERQGYQLARGFFLPPTKLEETEVFALLVMAYQWSAQNGLGLHRHAREGALKLVQSLSSETRARILTSAAAFRERPDAFEPTKARRIVEEALIAALARQHQVRLWYRDPVTLTVLSTKFSLYRVLLHDGAWFLIGRSSIRRRIEIVRLDAVLQIEPTEDRSSVPPRFQLERFLGLAWGVDSHPVRHQVWLRFSPKISQEISGRVWHRKQRLVEQADGHLDFHVTVDGIDGIVRWVLGFGSEVEVLAPQELRRIVLDTALRVAARHGGQSLQS